MFKALKCQTFVKVGSQKNYHIMNINMPAGVGAPPLDTPPPPSQNQLLSPTIFLNEPLIMLKVLKCQTFGKVGSRVVASTQCVPTLSSAM